MSFARDTRLLIRGHAELSKLEQAGLRVDLARAAMDRVHARYDRDLDEREFGVAEAALAEARDDFRRQLEILTGMDADVIAGRV